MDVKARIRELQRKRVLTRSEARELKTLLDSRKKKDREPE